MTLLPSCQRQPAERKAEVEESAEVEADTKAIAEAKGEAKAYKIEELPSELTGPVKAADAAIRGLKQRLGARLLEELKDGDPKKAIEVCRDEAQAITAAVEKEQGIAVGRTSHRLRSPKNAPRDWVRPYVQAAAEKKSADALAVDLGDRVGVLRPIPTGGVCIQCHGATETIAPELLQTLRAAYPEDRATGFSKGDLRGFFWAEAPK